MARHFSVNLNTPSAGYNYFIYQMKEFLKTYGWTVTQSGTGNSGTYNPSADSITGPGSLVDSSSPAGTMGHDHAWFVIQDPSGPGGRQFCIQVVGRDDLWRVKYSAGAGFTGGSPSANQTPTATDEQVLVGSGTDASPTGGGWFTYNSATHFYVHLVMETTAPYPFLLIAYNTGQNPSTVFGIDSLTAVPIADADPVVIYNSSNDTNCLIASSNLSSPTSSTGPMAWIKKGLVGAGFVRVGALSYYDQNRNPVIPGGLGANPHSNKDDLFPVVYGRSQSFSTPNGYKGVSHWFQFNTASRAHGDTLSVASSGIKDYVCWAGGSGVIMPWLGDGTTVPNL